MSGLDKYLCPITVGGKPLEDSLQAYKMDCTSEHSNMRKDVGLGTCNCCDYFRIEDDCVYLIEETTIKDTIEKLKLKYSDLDNNLCEKLVYDLIRDENRLKVYGSMLVLCRLATRINCLNSKLKDKSVKFILVVGTISGEDAKYFDDLCPILRNDLKSLLTAKIVADVAILDSDKLKASLLSSTN